MRKSIPYREGRAYCEWAKENHDDFNMIVSFSENPYSSQRCSISHKEWEKGFLDRRRALYLKSVSPSFKIIKISLILAMMDFLAGLVFLLCGGSSVQSNIFVATGWIIVAAGYLSPASGSPDMQLTLGEEM